MGSSKRNLLTSVLLLVVMGVFAVLTIFIVVDAINKKYYNDIKVEYEVQEESPNVILTFARNEGSNFSTDNTKVVLNEDKTKFRIDGTVPTIKNGIVTNLDEITSSEGREFYFFSTNSSFIDPQQDPENPDFIFSETDSRYYVSTEDNPIWYDVPKSSENLTLYSVFLTPNVHNSDFANAPLLNTSPNVIISHDVVDIPYNAFGDMSSAMTGGGELKIAKIETVVIPNSTKIINSKFDMMSEILGGAFAGCATLTNIIIPGSVEYVGGEAFMLCSRLDTVKYGNGYYLPTENNEHAILVDTNLKADNVTIHADCISIQGGAFSKYLFYYMIFMLPGGGAALEDYANIYLQRITIPKNVKNIGIGAFMSCIGLTNVEFEVDSNLTSIGAMSFACCSSLKTINLEDTKLEEIGDEAFGTLYNLIESPAIEEITLPSTLRTMGNGVFMFCTSLTSITIPEGVTSIGNSTFSSCSSLASITIPNSVTSIGNSAFSMCSSLTSISIPDSVTSIGNSAFFSCESLTSITIPVGITNIGDSVFKYCESLTSITIPSSVSRIEAGAFSDCSSLTSIIIPSSVTSIGSSAFSGCYKLVEVYDLTGSDGLNITAGSTDNGYVGYYADYVYTDKDTDLVQKEVDGDYIFYYNNDILYLLSYTGSEKELKLPSIDKVKEVFKDFSGDTYEIYEYAFYENKNITSVVIPNCVTSIGGEAFYNCSSLKTVTFGDNSQLTSIGDSAFTDCRSLKTVTFGDNSMLTSIGDSAFSDCSSLTSITIPSSVTSIGSSAFSGCYKLVEVYDLTGSEGLNITAGSWDNGFVGNYADYVYTDKDTDLVQKVVDGDYIFYYNNGIMYLLSYTGSEKELTLPSIDEVNKETGFDCNTYEIYEYAFYYDSNITSVVIPNCVTSIGNSAFESCSSLTSITIPNTVTSIGEFAFHYCESLTSITIPEGVTSIGNCTFYYCKSLTSITIPDTVTSIGNDAFYNCSSLTSIKIPDSVTSIGVAAFSSCSSLTSITIPEGVTSIGYQAFRHCRSLTSITIPDSVTSIGEGAFSSCNSLTSITIPESVTSIGYQTFYNCSSLTIYCEASSQPSGWYSSWNYSNRPVYWAGEWKHDEVTGKPVPIE